MPQPQLQKGGVALNLLLKKTKSIEYKLNYAAFISVRRWYTYISKTVSETSTSVLEVSRIMYIHQILSVLIHIACFWIRFFI